MAESEFLVAWDLDDTLGRQAGMVLSLLNSRMGTALTLDDYHDEWMVMTGLDRQGVEPHKEAFFTPEFMGSIEPIEEAQIAVGALSAICRQMVMTARRISVEPLTRGWLDTHYSNLFERVAYATYFDEDGVKHTRSKAEMCLEYGVDLLVDDQPKHCLAAAEVGIPAVLFGVGEYKWSILPTYPDNIYPVRSHQEAHDIVVDLARKAA